MKRAFVFLSCVLLCHYPVQANIAATTQWELRTTGNDSNGGGFNPKETSAGTDYSQQDSAQIAFTDLKIATGTSQAYSVANPLASFTPIATRGTNSNISATASITVTFPAGSAAGDLAILFVGSQAGITQPSGWTTLQNLFPANWSGSTLSKTLSSGDISTGSITINSPGSSAMVAAIQVFVDATKLQVRENQATGNNAATASVPLNTDGNVMSNDYGVWFASCRCGTLPTINQGSLAQSQNNTSNGTGVLYDGAINAPGQITATSTYAGYNTAGYYSSNVVIQPIYSPNPYVGNIVHTVSGTGCTVGWFEIISITGTLATFDRSLGTGGSTCTANLGGGLLTPQQAETAVNNSCFCNNPGETVWAKFGTYTITTVVTGGARQDHYWIGYNTVHGDQGGASLNWPTITTATNATDLFNLTQFNFGFSNFHFTNTAVGANKAHAINQSNGNAVNVANATFSGFKNALDFACCGSYINLRAITILSDTSSGIVVDHGQWASCDGCFIYGAGANGVDVAPGSGSNAFVCTNCVISGNTGFGIHSNNTGSQARIQCSNCTISGNGSGGIVENAASTTNSTLTIISVKSSIIYGNTGWGVNNTTNALVSQFVLENNAWGSNSSGNYPAVVQAGPGDVTLTASPFTNSAGGNFAPNSTAGGGTAIKAVGYPGNFFGSSTTGFIDIGGVQSQAAAGGVSACAFASLIHPPDTPVYHLSALQ